MKLIETVGATSRIWQIFIADSASTTGGGLTGLAYNTASLVCYYHRDVDTTAIAVTLVTMTLGTYTSGGFKEIDATNMPGWYQFCPPSTVLSASGGARSSAVHFKGAAGMAPLPIEVQMIAQDFQAASVAQTGDNFSVLSPTGNAGKSIGILHAGTLSAISATDVTLPGGNNLDHQGNYAIVLNSGTNAQGKARYLTYSGAGEVYTVDPAWNSDGETTPSGAITYSIVSAPKIPVASLPNVNTTKVSGTAQTARDLGLSVLVAATGLDAALDSANGVETGLSIRGQLRAVAAATVGQEAGRGTSTVTYAAALTHAKTRVTAVRDGSSNRATVTIDPT